MIKGRNTPVPSAAGAVIVMITAGCLSGDSSATSANEFFNAGLTKVVNPSDHRGGTLAFDLPGTPDSTDPGNMYLAYMLNVVRLYGAVADDLQVVPRQMWPATGARTGHRTGNRRRPRPDLDLPHPAGGEVLDRAAGHVRGRHVCGRAELCPLTPAPIGPRTSWA
jgi:hypothetical protein